MVGGLVGLLVGLLVGWLVGFLQQEGLKDRGLCTLLIRVEKKNERKNEAGKEIGTSSVKKVMLRLKGDGRTFSYAYG